MEPSQVNLHCNSHHLSIKLRNALLDLGYLASRHGKSVIVVCYNLAQLDQDLQELGVEFEVAR